MNFFFSNLEEQGKKNASVDLKGVAQYNCYITTMECKAITHSDLIRLHKIHHQKLDFGPRPHLSKKL